MKVLYHSDALAKNSRFGLGRYAVELHRALEQLDSEVELTAVANYRNEAASHGGDHGSVPELIHPSWNHRLLMLDWATIGIPCIERWCPHADLVHTVELDYPVATRRPWVVTVHDLGPLSHPEFFSASRPWLRRIGLQRAINKAAIIVAVSEATAKAIEHFSGMSLGERLRVIPEGVSEVFYEVPPADCLAGLDDLPGEQEPYFLWTGSINPRKNLVNVIKAFEQAAQDCEQHLVLAGGLGWDMSEELSIIAHSLHKDRIHRTGFVTDEQLRALYHGATAFVYVSFMEGFGLPILEAMAGGCPVITSNLSSMPEVAGDAGLLVNPANVDDIAAAMLKVAGEDATREQLRTLGIEQARRFSWETTAHAMLQAYNDAAA